ncbi:acetoacetate decarboxylase [Ilyomonas limi]|uniref:Acetoacetate decarboxylase n=1 Tax=Ilyomonas limi TaxID=2575867 RepID=A0A4U3LCQ1_9BACT|nr:acetoacetate decarboxylase family protein [Ilyomonas limi]TKK71846.1 acetoacetate decarboxylase [Ilyomonas limi]
MSVPKRIKTYAGRYALVDDVPFTLPVQAKNTPAFMAGFFCNYDKAKQLLPGNELYPFKFANGKAVFMVTVVNYVNTNIGKYIEYSIALACTKGKKQAPAMLPALLMKRYGTGQFILDLPVSSDISVKGGKGIWGMPKHKASLDFKVTDNTVSAQYEKDGQFAFRIEIEKPKRIIFPINIGATNYGHFRNMLMQSYIYFKAKAGICLGKKAKGTLYIGDHPRTAFMRNLDIESKPFFTLFMPSANGILDDHFQCWFVTYKDKPDKVTPEGFESVINLGLGEDWLPAPAVTDYEKYRI